MSPRNWNVCPVCKAKYACEREEAIAAVDRNYGVIALPEFLKQMKEAQARPASPGETLAEYWDIGVCADGTFIASYGSHCSECGFEFSFNHKVAAADVLAQKKHT